MTQFAEGNLVKLEAEYRDPANALFNPTAVSIKVTNPAGTTTTYVYGTDADLIRSSTGMYYINIDTTDKPGKWKYRWYSTGTGQAASNNLSFDVIANIPE